MKDDMKYEKFEPKTINYKAEKEWLNYGIKKRGKSWIRIGNMKQTSGGIGIQIESNAKFNWLQRKMWKFFFNIDIENIK